MVRAKGLYAGYGKHDIISDISFNANAGEILCVAGPNASGKSTLLKALLALIPYRGSVLIDGKEASGYGRRALAAKTALLGQIQEMYFPYTVRSTVAFGRYAHNEAAFADLSAADDEIIEAVMTELGLSEIAEQRLSDLSGGQLQRVFLARSLAQTPGILLLDEPTNHLDIKCGIELLDFIKERTRTQNMTVIAVLHDLALVRRYADKVLLIGEGRVAAEGVADEVFSSGIPEKVFGLNIGALMRENFLKWA